MPTRRIVLALAAALLIVSALSAAALANGPSIDMTWNLIGGGPTVSWGDVTLSGGVGQMAPGELVSNGESFCSGFWCAPGGAPWRMSLFLPAVLR